MKHLKKIFMNIIIEIETILENIFNQMKSVYWENHLYWKELSKIRPRREGPIRTRSYVKKEAPIIDFMTDQNQLWYEIISTQKLKLKNG